MSPLSKAKGKGLMIAVGVPKSDDEAEPEADDYGEEDILKEIASAVKEGDGEGAAQAVAAYVDACMAKHAEE